MDNLDSWWDFDSGTDQMLYNVIQYLVNHESESLVSVTRNYLSPIRAYLLKEKKRRNYWLLDTTSNRAENNING